MLNVLEFLDRAEWERVVSIAKDEPAARAFEFIEAMTAFALVAAENRRGDAAR